MAKITHYTAREGEIWRPWVYENQLKEIKKQLENPKISRIGHLVILEVEFDYYSFVHSFKTDDGRRWDAINGWNT